MIPADSVNALARPDSAPMLGIYVSLAGLVLSILGIAWAGGKLAGRFEAMKESYDREIRDLKKSVSEQDQHTITREELDARFGEVRAQLEALRDRMSDVVRICSEALKR